MSQMIRWDPFREMLSMRSMMDRILEDWDRPSSPRDSLIAPSVDLLQTPEDVIVRATLPGVKADDIRISVTADTVTLQGEISQESDIEGAQYHLRERRYGGFTRTLPLPAPVVADKGDARFEDGILTLTLPKADEVKPRQISVKAK